MTLRASAALRAAPPWHQQNVLPVCHCVEDRPLADVLGGRPDSVPCFPATPGPPAAVLALGFETCFWTAVLGVTVLPAAGPDVSPCAGPGAAIAAEAKPSATVKTPAAKSWILRIDFIGTSLTSRNAQTEPKFESRLFPAREQILLTDVEGQVLREIESAL